MPSYGLIVIQASCWAAPPAIRGRTRAAPWRPRRRRSAGRMATRRAASSAAAHPNSERARTPRRPGGAPPARHPSAFPAPSTPRSPPSSRGRGGGGGAGTWGVQVQRALLPVVLPASPDDNLVGFSVRESPLFSILRRLHLLLSFRPLRNFSQACLPRLPGVQRASPEGVLQPASCGLLLLPRLLLGGPGLLLGSVILSFGLGSTGAHASISLQYVQLYRRVAVVM